MNLKIGFGIFSMSLLVIYLLVFQDDKLGKIDLLTVDSQNYGKKNQIATESKAFTKAIAEPPTQNTIRATQRSSTSDTKVETTNTSKTPYDYDGDWCIASEDLSEDDIYRANKERKAWSLNRGMVFINKTPSDFESPEFNNEYVESYQELDLNTLIEFGNNDDRMALITLIQLENVDPTVRKSAAKNLVVLGDTAMGLQQLVIDHLVSAAFRYSEKQTVDNQVKDDLIDALALVEYGLKRKDVAALNTYLTFITNKDEALHGLVPDNVLSDSDLSAIEIRAHYFHDLINTERSNKNLPTLEEQELPRIATTIFNEDLAITNGEYGEILKGSRILELWNKSYLQKTSCLERLIARY